MKDARTEYADIIDLPHHVSAKHPQMPVSKRAAQFSPFAALTGYDEMITEVERQTGSRIELDEDSITALDEKLSWLLNYGRDAEATITYFVPDARKQGGEYVSVTGKIAKADRYKMNLAMQSGEVIRIKDIVAIDSPLFSGAEY